MTTFRISSPVRFLMVLAAIYNIAFAFWLYTSPQSLFALVRTTMPFDEMFVAPLAFSIGGAALLYILILVRPAWTWVLMVLVLLSKLLPLILVLVFMVMRDWPPQMLIFVFVNDVVWWIPLWRFFRKVSQYYGQRAAQG